jgi:hypothetical protein
MAERNRVTPANEIVATGLRCRWMGNRGCLHVDHEIVRPWRSTAWITCETSFRDRHLVQWQPNRYTALFFDDEAVALAAGHRPCAECRRPAYNAFLDAWEAAFGGRPKAKELDALLHADRLDGRDQRTHGRPWRSLPDGVFVRLDGDGEVGVVRGDAIATWTAERGYGASRRRPRAGRATVLTPAATVEILHHGYPPDG